MHLQHLKPFNIKSSNIALQSLGPELPDELRGSFSLRVKTSSTLIVAFGSGVIIQGCNLGVLLLGTLCSEQQQWCDNSVSP
jgi:hypothetical protein